LLNNEARNVFFSTLKTEYQQSLDLNACPIERGLSVVTTACPQDDNPLSYDRLDGEWLVWYQVAHRFERKVPSPDRADIRHSIILELALARRRDGQPIPILRAYRIASLTIALYWRKEKRKPTILSLDHQTSIGDGDTAELINTIADDKAIDISAWIDAKTWLLGCPTRLVQIAMKRVNKIPLDRKDQKYLERFRIQERQRLLNYVAN
jgi:hypothetical protein